MRSRNLMTLFRRETVAGPLVEFAVVFPVLCVLLFGVIDLGFYVYAHNTLSAAARDGARYAIVRSRVSGSEATADSVRNFVLTRIPFRNMGGGVNVATTWPTGNSPGNPVLVNVQYTFTPISGLNVLGRGTLRSSSRMVITN